MLCPGLPQVTFFWNGNRSGYFDEALETYVEIPSDTVPFNEAPDMKAREITEAGKEALLSGKYDMVRVNYANPGARTSLVSGYLAVCRRLEPRLPMPARVCAFHLTIDNLAFLVEVRDQGCLCQPGCARPLGLRPIWLWAEAPK